LAVVTGLVALCQNVSAQALHRLGSLTILSNASAQLTLSGSAPSSFINYFDLYPVEASSNLRDWTAIGTALRTNSSALPLRFLDPEAARLALRFYRTPTNHLITALPKPTGPYPVGRIDRLLVDTNRPDRLPFMISIWYPAARESYEHLRKAAVKLESVAKRVPAVHSEVARARLGSNQTHSIRSRAGTKERSGQRAPGRSLSPHGKETSERGIGSVVETITAIGREAACQRRWRF
jgi:hypothetical protein